MPIVPVPADMSPEVMALIDALGGSRVREAIVHTLSKSGPLTTAELAPHVGTEGYPLRKHLDSLEASGLVTGSLPIGQRARRTVRWTANRLAIAENLRKRHAYLLGEASGLERAT